jgi:hypothetical protein
VDFSLLTLGDIEWSRKSSWEGAGEQTGRLIHWIEACCNLGLALQEIAFLIKKRWYTSA